MSYKQSKSAPDTTPSNHQWATNNVRLPAIDFMQLSNASGRGATCPDYGYEAGNDNVMGVAGGVYDIPQIINKRMVRNASPGGARLASHGKRWNDEMIENNEAREGTDDNFGYGSTYRSRDLKAAAVKSNEDIRSDYQDSSNEVMQSNEAMESNEALKTKDAKEQDYENFSYGPRNKIVEWEEAEGMETNEQVGNSEATNIDPHSARVENIGFQALRYGNGIPWPSQYHYNR